MGRAKETEPLLNGTQWQNKNQWTQTETQEISYERTRTLFTVMVMKHWNSLPRETVESPSLKILKSQLDMALSNMLRLTLFEQGMDWTTSRGAHQLQPCSDSMKLQEKCCPAGVLTRREHLNFPQNITGSLQTQRCK